MEFEIVLSSPIPGARVISPFGYRTHPVTGQADFHEGIDLAAPLGTPVLAAASGSVILVSSESSAITYVAIQHNGAIAYYLHLDEIKVSVGERVAGGQQIGTLGEYVRSTTPNLHFEVYKLANPEELVAEL